MSHFPDMPTVYAACCVVNLLLSLGLLLVYLSSSTYPGFRQWAAGAASVFVVCALMASSRWLPSGPTTLLVNLVFFSYPLLLARGLRSFLGQPPRRWTTWLALGSVVLVAGALTFVWPDPHLRVFVLSMLLVPLFADCALLARRLPSYTHPAVKVSLMAAFAFLSIWSLLRVPLDLAMTRWLGTGPNPPLLQAATLLAITGANLWICLGLTSLNHARSSESLRESEERFRNLAEAAFEGILISESGLIIEANQQALHLLGYDWADLIGQPANVLTPPGREALLSPVPAAVPGAARELWLRRRNGAEFPVEVLTRQLESKERVVQITALHDLSERRRMEQALAASEERFRSAMYHAPIGMAIVALDGHWLEVNPALARITGYSREELLRRDFQSVTHPEDRLPDAQLLERLLARNIPSYYREKRYVHRAGHIVWVHVHVSLILNPDGTPRHIVAQTIDVSERRRTEATLRENQARLGQAMDMAKLGHWEFDLAARRFTFDESFLRLLRTSASREGGFEMAAEEYARRFLSPAAATRLEQETQAAVAAPDQDHRRQFEHDFIRADGTKGTMSVRFATRRDETGRVTRTFGFSQDVTEQAEAARQHRMLEDQLRHAQKMDALGTLAGGIAHDFNNVLTGIMGNLQLAGMDLGPGHPAQDRIRDAARASERARDQVARILAFSRRYQGERSATALGPLVQEVAQLLRASLPVTIEIRTQLAADCPPVVCDPAQMHQVVMNLGTNAAHAMQERGGVLEIALDSVEPDHALRQRHPQVQPDHRVRLNVRDTGTGIEPEVLARIFEPFFTTKPSDQGTGLGLAMVHGIVEDHRGAIVVTSEVGRGTTFSLYFPATTRTASAPPETSSSTDPLPRFGRGRRVLVVDDDPAVLTLAQSIVERSGFVAEGHTHPSSAAASFARDPESYAAIVSDLTMPGMTGVELAQRLHAIRPGLPFILTSGYLHAEAFDGARQSGIAFFVRKPFDIAELTTVLRQALERSPSA